MKKTMAAVLLAPMIATGCTTGPNETVGTLGGAAVGAAVGSQIGDGSGRLVATALGTVAGGLVGQQLGRRLDERSRERALAAEYRALEYGASGQPVTWRNPDSGYYGEVTPQSAYQVNGRDCRQYVHTIYVDGQPQTARGTACRQADGTWAPVA